MRALASSALKLSLLHLGMPCQHSCTYRSLCSLLLACAELDNFPEGEVEEMVQLYTKRGLPEHSARSIITAMASSPQFFVDVMMLEELQMSPPPALTALSAASRVAGGMLACGGSLLVSSVMLDRALSEPPHRGASSSFLGCSTPYLVLLSLAMLALSYLGWLRASITHQEKRKLALQTCACVLPCTTRAANTAVTNTLQDNRSARAWAPCLILYYPEP